MRSIIPEDFKKAYKKEKDPKIRPRMLAVHMYYVRNKDVQEIAQDLLQCPNWVTRWVERFEKEGLDGFRDLPKCGRPVKISHKKMDQIILKTSSEHITPVQLQQILFTETGITLHITHVRKIMHRYNLSPKKPNLINVNRANKRTVSNWKYHLKKKIPRLEKK